ncbi:MAG: UDP-N-acetylmuramoyl-tripeptide--D-alanyl-D-alanine ligase [Bdellovibrionales bacterium]
MITQGYLLDNDENDPKAEGVSSNLERPFEGISIDSRSLKENQIFFAVKGKNLDGHAFVSDALTKGASVAVVEEGFSDIQDPRLLHVSNSLLTLHALARKIRQHYNPLTIAVTGSVGKTTTKNYIGEMFSKIAKTVSSQKSYNNEFGIPLTLAKIDKETQYACIEVGINTPGEMEWLVSTVLPDIAVITNIGMAHVGRFGTVETILKEKAKIFDGLPSDGIAVLNADDSFLLSLKKELASNNKNVLWFGSNSDANIKLLKKEIKEEGQQLEIDTPKGKVNALIAPSDQGTLYACLASISVGIAAGLDLKKITATLKDLHPESRLKISKFKHGRIIDDSYNASVASVLNGINLIKDTGEHGIFVLGDIREVGDHLLDSYVEILNSVKAMNGDVIAIGETGEFWKEAATITDFDTKNLTVVEKWDEAVNALSQKEIPDNTGIFVKGSRFSHLERIALFMNGKKSACLKVSCSKYIHCSECPTFNP